MNSKYHTLLRIERIDFLASYGNVVARYHPAQMDFDDSIAPQHVAC